MKQLMIPIVAVGLALGGWSSAQASLVSLDAAMAATQDVSQAAVSGELLIADAAAQQAPAGTLVLAGTDVQVAGALQLCNRRDPIISESIRRDTMKGDPIVRQPGAGYQIKHDQIVSDRIQRDPILGERITGERIQVDP